MGEEGSGFFWVEESNTNPNKNVWMEEEEEEEEEVEEEEEDEMYSSVVVGTKRKYTKRIERLEFAGWGSKPLFDFLQHIGRETASPISQYDVAGLVDKYVKDRSLLHPSKKKRVVCDEWLLLLLGRRTVSRVKIYELLGSHFAENVIDSDNDSSSIFEEADGGASYSTHERLPQKNLKSAAKKKVVEMLNKSCFAAIVSDNIKLVYLRKGLVQKLVKEQPKTFEGKVVGGFVRIKSDPYDYLQKNSHILVQVMGIKRNPTIDDKSAEILLQVSNCVKDISISMLSDENFSKEECEDLHRRVKDGLLKRLTVVELEEKVHTLHEDMTKHWLVGEIALLQRHIDRANEKGWRRELAEYMERKQLLQTAEEQLRLLREVPKVIAEEIEVQNVTAEEIEFQKVIVEDTEVQSGWCDSPDNTPGTDSYLSTTVCGALKFPLCNATANESSSNSFSIGTNMSVSHPCVTSSTNNNQIDKDLVEQQQKKQATEMQCESCGETQPSNPEEEKLHASNMSVDQCVPVVIDLSDDEEQTEHPSDNYDLESVIWNYTDPQGNAQGPFPVTSLKRWNEAGYFPTDFKVWKTGQGQEAAMLLRDVLRWANPR